MERLKKALVFLLLWCVHFTVQPQTDENPAVWKHQVNALSDGEYELVFAADIADEWFIYSLYTAEGGSMPSEFEFVGVGEDYELIGKTEEGKTYKKYTEV